jgi:hypothetical protein
MYLEFKNLKISEVFKFLVPIYSNISEIKKTSSITSVSKVFFGGVGFFFCRKLGLPEIRRFCRKAAILLISHTVEYNCVGEEGAG